MWKAFPGHKLIALIEGPFKTIEHTKLIRRYTETEKPLTIISPLFAPEVVNMTNTTQVNVMTWNLFINNKYIPLLQTLTGVPLFLSRSILNSLLFLPHHRRYSSFLYGARHRPVLQLEPHCCVETMSNIQRWGWLFSHSFIHIFK